MLKRIALHFNEPPCCNVKVLLLNALGELLQAVRILIIPHCSGATVCHSRATGRQKAYGSVKARQKVLPPFDEALR
jgi:hypothetical protein